MALAFRSQQTSSVLANHTVVCTKPAGLALNDIMIAHHVTGNCGSAGPAGWTQFSSQSQGDATSGIYGRLATSGDVAASDFSFTETLCGTSNQSVAILAFSGGDTTDPFSPDSSNKAASGTALTTGTITPDEADTIILLFATWSDRTVSASSPAIATSDPGGWQEAYDGLASPSGANFRLAGYYSGIRSQTTGTGDGQVTISSTAQWILQMVAINPGASASGAKLLNLLGVGT